MKFKTLVNTDPKKIKYMGRYIHFINKENNGSGRIPQLLGKSANMKIIKKAYPKQNLEGIKLITVELKEIK